MIPLSDLDLAPVGEGRDVPQAFAHMRDLARHAEQFGTLATRYPARHRSGLSEVRSDAR